MYDSCRTSDKSVLDLNRGSIRKRSIVRSRSRCSVNFRAKSDSSVTESLPDAPAGAAPVTLDSGSSGSLMNFVSKRIAKKGSHILPWPEPASGRRQKSNPRQHLTRPPWQTAQPNRPGYLARHQSARHQSLRSPNGLTGRLQPKKWRSFPIRGRFISSALSSTGPSAAGLFQIYPRFFGESQFNWAFCSVFAGNDSRNLP